MLEQFVHRLHPFTLNNLSLGIWNQDRHESLFRKCGLLRLYLPWYLRKRSLFRDQLVVPTPVRSLAVLSYGDSSASGSHLALKEAVDENCINIDIGGLRRLKTSIVIWSAVYRTNTVTFDTVHLNYILKRVLFFALSDALLLIWLNNEKYSQGYNYIAKLYIFASLCGYFF